MIIDLTTLPTSIQQQIPVSIRSFKSVYDITELPLSVQYLIKSYLTQSLTVKYNVVFDTKPIISEYSDLQTIVTVTDLIVEYLKNYLVITPESYPFDPLFGCRLKQQLQTRDTSLRKTLISSEINNVVNVITADVGSSISIDAINILPISTGSATEYNVDIPVTVNQSEKKKINMTFLE